MTLKPDIDTISKLREWKRMPGKSTHELRTHTKQELEERLQEARHTKLKLMTINKMAPGKVGGLRKCRKEIAKILTILHEKSYRK